MNIIAKIHSLPKKTKTKLNQFTPIQDACIFEEVDIVHAIFSNMQSVYLMFIP